MSAEFGMRTAECGMTAEQAWLARPEAKFERARECVHGVVSRLRALLACDAPGVCESLAPDEVEMLMLQLKLGAGHLGASAVALREVEEERKALAAWRQREEMRFEGVPAVEDGMTLMTSMT